MVIGSLLIAVLVLGLGSGLAAVLTGRVVPWGRGRIVRPRLWGYGQLLISAMILVQGLWYFEILPLPRETAPLHTSVLIIATAMLAAILGQKLPRRERN